MTARPYAPKVKLTTLWQRRSASGRTYFSGFLGAARLVVFKDEEADLPDGVDGIWNVLVEEKQEQSETSRRREVLPRSEPVGEGGRRIDTRSPRRSDQPTGEPDFNDRLADLETLRGGGS